MFLNNKWLIGLVAIAFATGVTRATFTPGDVIAQTTYGKVINVTVGGTYSSGNALASIGPGDISDIGKVAFSADNTLMYFSDYDNGDVYATTSIGAVSVFATGLSEPAGLLRTNTGRLLVAEEGTGEVTDITTGGDFTNAVAFANGMRAVGDLVQTSDGRLFAAGSYSGQIYNITGGGFIGKDSHFGPVGHQPFGLIAANSGGGMMMADPGGFVWSISSTGAATVFASQIDAFTIAYSGDGKLLATEGGNNISDISAGGDVHSAPLFGVVTDDYVDSLTTVPAPLPEPASLGLLAIASLATLRRRRRGD